MAQLLDRVEKDIKDRLEQLRPALQEARELEEALKQLTSQRRQPGGAATTTSRTRATASTPARGRRRARRSGTGTGTGGARRGRRTRVSGEKRREQLVSLARENPNIKAREIAEQLGTTPNNIYNLIRRLEAEGVISRRDGRLVVKRG